MEPTAAPTAEPTPEPSMEPTAAPTAEPTPEPSMEPTAAPTAEPTPEPSMEPTAAPTAEPTPEPSMEPTAAPTAEPTPEPSMEPTAAPSGMPSAAPGPVPLESSEPSPGPSESPTAEPSATPTGPVGDYIVTFIAGTSAAQQGRSLDAAGVGLLDTIPALAMSVVSATADQAQTLRADAFVGTVERDRRRDIEAAPSDPRYADQWSLRRIDWPEARGTIDPAGEAIVAILDTGVDVGHGDLDANLVPGRGIVEGSDPQADPNGHGTAMAGIVAAETDNGAAVAGVGYDGVSVMPVTVLGANGVGRDSDIIEGLVWATTNGADVILMAFSNPGRSSALQAAVDYAWARGVVVVASVGNDATIVPAYPAGLSGVIGVSSTDRDDALAPTSSSGAAVFMAAPGVDIVTTEAGGAAVTVGGTSAAAAHVAAAAALIRAADPGVGPGIIAARLARTADPAGTVEQTGNGRLNLLRALSDTGDGNLRPTGAPDGGPFIGPFDGSDDEPNYAADADADLSITKTLEPGAVVAGEPVTYVIVVSNSSLSPDPASAVQVADVIPSELTGAVYCVGAGCDLSISAAPWSSPLILGNLAPGESETVKIRARAAASDPGGTTMTNVATVSSSTPDSVTDNNQAMAEATTLAPVPSLGLAKTAAPTAYDSVGDQIAYTYIITNSGNVTVTAPFSVADDKATTVTCPLAPLSLAPGDPATVTCTAVYTITQADITTGSVTNIATASAPWAGGTGSSVPATATVTYTAPLPPGGAEPPFFYETPGDVISYDYDVTNGGNVRIPGPVTVDDDMATVTCPAVSTVGNGDAFLDPGESITCTASYTVSQTDVDGGSVTNIAKAFGNSGLVASNPDMATASASQAIVLTLDKRVPAGASYERVGDVIDYDYVLGNGGNTTLSAPFAVSDDKTTVSCPATPASLAPGESLTCTAAYGVSQADLDAGSVTNTASATALDVDGRTVTSDEDAETVAASQAIVLTLDKRVPAGASYERVGDVIDYDYVLGNGGNTTLSAPFAVSDDKTTVSCPATPASLAPGESLTCTAAYGVSQADLDAGSVTNTASATALDVDGRTVTSDEDAETVAASQAIVLTLDKRVPAAPATSASATSSTTTTCSATAATRPSPRPSR